MSTSVVARQGVGSLRQSSHHRDHLACRQKQGRCSAKLPGVDTCGPVRAIVQPRSDLQGGYLVALPSEQMRTARAV